MWFKTCVKFYDLYLELLILFSNPTRVINPICILRTFENIKSSNFELRFQDSNEQIKTNQLEFTLIDCN